MATNAQPPTVAGFSMDDLRQRMMLSLLDATAYADLKQFVEQLADKSAAIHVGKNPGNRTILI